MIGFVINTALALGAGKVAYRWLLPKTTIRMSGEIFVVYTDIDTFMDRWQRAMRSKTLMPLSPYLYLNPLQIMYAEGRRR